MKLLTLIPFFLCSSLSVWAGPGSSGGEVSESAFTLDCHGAGFLSDVTGSAVLGGAGVLESQALGRFAVTASGYYGSDGLLSRITLEGVSMSGALVTLALPVPSDFVAQDEQEFDAVATAAVAGQATLLRCHFSVAQ